MKTINDSLIAWWRAAWRIASLLGVVMIGIIWLGAAFHLNGLRQIAEEAAVRNSANLARAFEEHLVRSIEEVDRVLLFLRGKYEEGATAFDFANLKDVENSNIVSRIGIIGADGLLRASSGGPLRIPVDLRDREHFQIHINAVGDQLIIAKPVISQTTGKWVIPLSRRIRNKDGSFGGVIAATIDTSYFTRFYNSVYLGSGGAIALIGLTDGVFRASENPASNVHGTCVTDFLAYLSHLTAPDGWYFSDAAWNDRIRRLVSYRAIRTFPLVVMVGISHREILASSEFQQRAINYAVRGSTALILLVIAFNIWNELNLARARSALQSQNVRFDAAINNMSQGLCMFDADKRLVVCNERYVEMYRLPVELTKGGTSHDEIIKHRVLQGILKGESNERAAQKKLADLLQHSLHKNSSRIDELADGRLIRVTREPMEGGGWVATHEDVTEQKQSETQIAYLAHHDALTGLANRASFMSKIEEAAARQRRSGEAFSILILDLDHFKNVNDTLGHPAGDTLLRDVAARLNSALRETDMLARLGGDEFAIIQAGEVNQREAAGALANRIIEIITKPFKIDGHQLHIGTSIGIAWAPEHGLDHDDLLKKADLALYRVKSAGRKGFRFFEAEMSETAGVRRLFENDLRQALAQNELELHYQPIVNSSTYKLRSVEALVRWRHPTKGLILPDQFIPIAEEIGLINQIGEWVLQTACHEAATWPASINVAVNLSPVQLRKSSLNDIVMRALAESGLPPARLELELTETALFDNAAECLSMMRQFRNLGIAIVLDDFGTGYSSLSQLTIFPIDKIKIDKSFTQNVTKRADCAAIISATLTLADSLGITTTAEGVETVDQVRLLQLAGVTLLQGYLFARPGPASQINFTGAYSAREVEDAA